MNLMKIIRPRCTPTQFLLLFAVCLLTLLLWRISNLQSTPTGLLYRVVLIGDIRNVDRDNNYNDDDSTRLDYFPQRRLAKQWHSLGVDRVIQPGDSLDSRAYRGAFLRDLIDSFAVPWHHSIGPYSVSPVPGFVFAFLHSYEVGGALGMDEVGGLDSSALSRVAEDNRLLNESNSSVNKNPSRRREGLDLQRAKVIGESQLAWLNQTIIKARVKDEKVIVISHVPIHPGAVADQSNLARDYERVLGIILSEGRRVVVAAFAGRDRDGSFHYKGQKNILFLTLGATSATDTESTDYAMCDLFSDRMQIQGYGKVPSFIVPFR